MRHHMDRKAEMHWGAKYAHKEAILEMDAAAWAELPLIALHGAIPKFLIYIIKRKKGRNGPLRH